MPLAEPKLESLDMCDSEGPRGFYCPYHSILCISKEITKNRWVSNECERLTVFQMFGREAPCCPCWFPVICKSEYEKLMGGLHEACIGIFVQMFLTISTVTRSQHHDNWAVQRTFSVDRFLNGCLFCFVSFYH